MRITVRLGARRDGTLTAMQLRTVADTGAYGNHAAGVLHHSSNEAVSLYRCPAKRVNAWAAYTNTVPAGAFRGTGCPRPGSRWNPPWMSWPASSASTRSRSAGGT